MNPRRVILAAAAWLTVSALARADSVLKTDGPPTIGDVTAISREEVTVQQKTASVRVPVNEIDTIVFSDEPARLKAARTAIQAGRYEDAVTGLESIDLNTVPRAEIKQDVQYYTALASARIALTGADEKAVRDAGSLMIGFVTSNPNSYHDLAAREVIGDLLVALGQHAKAREYYAELGKAPWPDYKMRSAVAVGRALLAEDQVDEALKSFETALGTQAQGESAERQRMAAVLGKARCLAEKAAGQKPDAAGKLVDEAVKLVEDVIAKANPEEVDLHARAYNTLGTAHVRAGRTQDALLAFLHVTELYFTSPKEHIVALENLVDLWGQVRKPERAEECATILREQYKRNP